MVKLTTKSDGQSELPLSNSAVAQKLDELADVLDSQNANAFRVKAYRIAAETIRNTTESLSSIIDRDGLDGLMKLRGVGQSLARSIAHLVHTGHLQLLDQSRSGSRAEAMLSTVPGIGPVTASRIQNELGIESLSELRSAAYDGRLAGLSGFGSKRIRAIRDCLAGRTAAVEHQTSRVRRSDQFIPNVSELLDIDAEYRRKADEDRLLRIAPRRFNPTRQAWLPILHTHRGSRNYTAMFTNTAKAHEMGTTHDWVVIISDDPGFHGQWTVITSEFGKMKGQRIIRGYENECAEFYRNLSSDERSLVKPRLFEDVDN